MKMGENIVLDVEVIWNSHVHDVRAAEMYSEQNPGRRENKMNYLFSSRHSGMNFEIVDVMKLNFRIFKLWAFYLCIINSFFDTLIKLEKKYFLLDSFN